MQKKKIIKQCSVQVKVLSHSRPYNHAKAVVTRLSSNERNYLKQNIVLKAKMLLLSLGRMLTLKIRFSEYSTSVTSGFKHVLLSSDS